MASPEDITEQWNLLGIHRRNLVRLLRQQAQHGPAHTPLGTLNSIDAERANIRRVKGILRGWGEVVEDHPDDEPTTSPKPSDRRQPGETVQTPTATGGEPTTQIGRDQVNVHDSPGAIAGSAGVVSQNFGEQNNTNAGTVIHIHGGDFKGANLGFGNTIGSHLNQSAGQTTTSIFDHRNRNLQDNVCNIPGNLNLSANPSKDEFIAALWQLKDALATAEDLPADEASDLNEDLDDAIESAERPQPNKDRTVKKLIAMQEIIDGLKDNVGSALVLGHLIGQVVKVAQGLLF